jgi:hypothetical protein
MAAKEEWRFLSIGHGGVRQLLTGTMKIWLTDGLLFSIFSVGNCVEQWKTLERLVGHIKGEHCEYELNDPRQIPKVQISLQDDMLDGIKHGI